ncbi:MAG TPA: hypothetical protein VF987_00360 [Rhodospirillales bacterium]
MKKVLVSWLLAGLLAALMPAGASAAPQVLAALSSEVGIPFTCDGVDCWAQLSTYCMLRNRPAPILGKEYVPAVPERFTLVITDVQGRERSLLAADHVRFFESRAFMSVAAWIPRADLEQLGAVTAVIRVADNAALLPVPEPGDPNPLTAKEIAYATGSLREESARLLETRPEAATARVLAAITNHLPYSQDFDTGETGNLVDKVIEKIPAASSDRVGVGQARVKVRMCVGDVTHMRFRTMRGCLESKHDQLIRELNVDYWHSQTGS